jgi:hypothetical protein
MAHTFEIPKLNDRQIVSSLGNVAVKLFPDKKAFIRVNLHHGPHVDLAEEKPEEDPKIQYVLDLASCVVPSFELIDADYNRAALQVTRSNDGTTDKVIITDSWIQHRQPRDANSFSKVFVELLASARSELKALDVEVSREYAEAKPWNKYRTLQTQVLKGLSDSAQELIVQTAKTNASLDEQRALKYDQLEEKLRAELQAEREELQKAYEIKQAELTFREETLTEREADFETKDSHYVARKQRQEQIEEVKEWLNDWSLTKATKYKRLPITIAYIASILGTAALTAYSVKHSYGLLDTVDAASKLAWWQWVGISLKVLLPFGAFTSLLVSFIRWASSWARQHAEEEFRNRTLLIDIGRSSWLLEAVRDAQERKSDIPPDLLRELSRNLFAATSGTEQDFHSSAISDVLLQGLSSLRVKTPDGTEVEATRKK